MDINSSWYYKISSDGFSRYFIIKEILKKIFGQKPIKILDVGGKENSLWAMIKDENLPYAFTAIDILPPDGSTKNYHYIQDDATQMKFKDNSFDTVVTADVLEHIEEEKKEIFINECFRVTKDLAIIAAPFDSEETEFSEHTVNDFYTKIVGKNHPWLKEHFEMKKPEKKMIEKILKSQKLDYLFFESNSLKNWVGYLMINFLTSKNLLDQKLAEEINLLYNKELFYTDDFDPPCYRQFYVVFKNKSLKKSLNYLLPIKKNFKKIILLKKRLFDTIKNQLSQKSQEAENYKNQLNQTLSLVETVKKEIKEKNKKIKDLENKLKVIRLKEKEEKRRLTEENQNLQNQIEQTKTHIQNLDSTLNMIKSAKFFKLWQGYNKILRVLKLKG